MCTTAASLPLHKASHEETLRGRQKTLSSITNKIDAYARKLSLATLDAAHSGKNKVLDFVIKKGEWDNFMSDINKAVQKMNVEKYSGKVTIR